MPLALYTDWKNVYVRVPNAEEQVTGAVPLTQFGRMCASWGIQILAASSPQAKGRVERNHGTHQDRLVKKLRRLGIAEAVAANAFLETTYLPEHNDRFVQTPASAEDFHRRTPSRVALGSRVPDRGDARALERLGDPLRHAVLASGAAESPRARPQYGTGTRERGRARLSFAIAGA